MQDKDNHLTEQEKALLALFRELDGTGRRRVMLAAKSVKVAAEQRNRDTFAFAI